MKPIGEYVEKAARLLNLKRSGLLTREEFARRANSLAMKYQETIRGQPDQLAYTLEILDLVKKRADELRSV